MFGASKTNSASTGGVSDPQFNYVTLLLDGNGTNGGQNNTFIDSSGNNRAITRLGNTTQGSFSPYGNLWSNNFSAGNFLSTPVNANINPTSQTSWTLEAWIYPRNYSGQPLLFSIGLLNTAINMRCNINTDGTLAYVSGSNGWGYTATFNSTGTVNLNTWNHIVFTRNGNAITIYINGINAGSNSSFNFGSGNTGYFYINSYFGSTGYTAQDFDGYISNVRYTNTIVYSSTFTPSITPLTAISGTQLLTCQSNRFVDNSSNNLIFTTTGTPSVQRFSPFNPAVSYATATIGGSGYFDNAGDYLTKSSFSLSSDFSIGCWVYANNNSYNPIFSLGDSNTSSGLEVVCGSEFRLLSGGSGRITGSAKTTGGQWSYVVLTRSSGTVTLYVNGVQAGSTWSSSTTFSGTLYVGAENYGGVSDYYYGYISNFFVNNTTAVSETVPTSPITNSTGSYLLLNFTNASIPDYAMMNDLETVGNAQISTSVKKFGTGSIYFDGTGSSLIGANMPPLGTGNFTVEGWVNIPTIQTSGEMGIFSLSGTSDSPSNDALSLATTGGKWFITYNNTYAVSAITPTANQWYFIAIVRNAGTTKLYVNGTSIISVTDGYNYSGTYALLGYYYTSGSYLFTGYLDDIRITKGYARYTANFTPPTTALPTY